jgi:hypothetical protein
MHNKCLSPPFLSLSVTLSLSLSLSLCLDSHYRSSPPQVVEQNFTYLFNVCGAVAGGIPSACSTVTGIGKAGALQVDTRVLSDPSDDYCFLAGVYGDSSTKVSLLDQEDPSKGISVTYFGSYCHTPMVQRKFRIELECADKLSPIPTSALEYDHCSYTVTMPSVYGCPLECPVANRALCGGNGHCSYDVDKAAARCFCNHGTPLHPPPPLSPLPASLSLSLSLSLLSLSDYISPYQGYRGSSCTEKGEAEEELNYSPVLFGLIITLFVIIGLLVVAIYFMIRQMSAFKEDITNYHVPPPPPPSSPPLHPAHPPLPTVAQGRGVRVYLVAFYLTSVHTSLSESVVSQSASLPLDHPNSIFDRLSGGDSQQRRRSVG